MFLLVRCRINRCPRPPRRPMLREWHRCPENHLCKLPQIPWTRTRHPLMCCQMRLLQVASQLMPKLPRHLRARPASKSIPQQSRLNKRKTLKISWMSCPTCKKPIMQKALLDLLTQMPGSSREVCCLGLWASDGNGGSRERVSSKLVKLTPTRTLGRLRAPTLTLLPLWSRSCLELSFAIYEPPLGVSFQPFD